MTARLPFDPSKMRAAATPAPSAPPNSDSPLTVSALAALITAALERIDRPIRVLGEVSGFRERTHWYFDLKDDAAVINCVMFASAARKAGFTLQNGQSLVATGRLDFFAKGGKVSFICDRIQPVGAGALELAFRKLVEEIRALGWFDDARKRPLPSFPRRVAVVTSRTGAALQDVLDTARRRCPAVEFAVLDVRVQGERAAPEIAAALNWLSANHRSLAIDAILLTRGGGSIEDLWAFNERIVAHAIVHSDIPVVAAIGHETDTTIAELVADLRCATPTQAAMRLVPDAAALNEQLDALRARLATVLNRQSDLAKRQLAHDTRNLASAARMTLAHARLRLERLANRLEQHRPAAAQARRQSRLLDANRRLHAAITRQLARHDLDALHAQLNRAARAITPRRAERLAALQRTLTAISPLRVLARGYSVTTGPNGRAVRSPDDVRPGDPLTTRLETGILRSTVDPESPAPKRPAHHTTDPQRPNQTSTPRRDKPSDSQQSLFG